MGERVSTDRPNDLEEMKCIEKRTDLAAEQTDLPLAPDTNRQTQKI